jgi:hypothetical protein
MSFQGALETLVGTFVAFYIGCVSIGRPDIPMKVVTELRVKALAGTRASWNCPSIFNHRDACYSYDPRRYR